MVCEMKNARNMIFPFACLLVLSLVSNSAAQDASEEELQNFLQLSGSLLLQPAQTRTVAVYALPEDDELMPLGSEIDANQQRAKIADDKSSTTQTPSPVDNNKSTSPAPTTGISNGHTTHPVTKQIPSSPQLNYPQIPYAFAYNQFYPSFPKMVPYPFGFSPITAYPPIVPQISPFFYTQNSQTAQSFASSLPKHCKTAVALGQQLPLSCQMFIQSSAIQGQQKPVQGSHGSPKGCQCSGPSSPTALGFLQVPTQSGFGYNPSSAAISSVGPQGLSEFPAEYFMAPNQLQTFRNYVMNSANPNMYMMAANVRK